METPGQLHSKGRSTVPDMGKVLSHRHHIFRKTDSTYTKQDRCGGVSGWCTQSLCRYRHHTFICYKYYVKHTCKQCNLDRLNKTGIVVYLGVVPTLRVDTVLTFTFHKYHTFICHKYHVKHTGKQCSLNCLRSHRS